jgi:hypothetical protein
MTKWMLALFLMTLGVGATLAQKPPAVRHSPKKTAQTFPAPVIASLMPTSSGRLTRVEVKMVAQNIQIDPTNSAKNPKVMFNGKQMPVYSIGCNSNLLCTLRFQMPYGAAAGVVNVVVTNMDGQSATTTFTYLKDCETFWQSATSTTQVCDP